MCVCLSSPDLPCVHVVGEGTCCLCMRGGGGGGITMQIGPPPALEIARLTSLSDDSLDTL